jgi:hypothetical protein
VGDQGPVAVRRGVQQRQHTEREYRHCIVVAHPQRPFNEEPSAFAVPDFSTRVDRNDHRLQFIFLCFYFLFLCVFVFISLRKPFVTFRKPWIMFFILKNMGGVKIMYYFNFATYIIYNRESVNISSPPRGCRSSFDCTTLNHNEMCIIKTK